MIASKTINVDNIYWPFFTYDNVENLEILTISVQDVKKISQSLVQQSIAPKEEKRSSIWKFFLLEIQTPRERFGNLWKCINACFRSTSQKLSKMFKNFWCTSDNNFEYLQSVSLTFLSISKILRRIIFIIQKVNFWRGGKKRFRKLNFHLNKCKNIHC